MPNFKFFFNNKAKVLDVVLHGGSYSMDSSFIQKVIDAGRKVSHSVIAFNFPYLDRGEDHSSGPKLEEELKTLKEILDFCQAEKYENIRLIGKSFGGIVASYFLKNLSGQEAQKYSVIVLGYVLGEGGIDLKGFSGKITIIQGQKDRFGDISAVKKDMAKATSKDVAYFEVAVADHSYRNPETKEPVFEDEAVNLIP